MESALKISIEGQDMNLKEQAWKKSNTLLRKSTSGAQDDGSYIDSSPGEVSVLDSVHLDFVGSSNSGII